VGRRIDEDRAAIFYELSKWFNLKVEYRAMKFEDIFRKLRQFDHSPHQNLAYSKKWLKKCIKKVSQYTPNRIMNTFDVPKLLL